jgi:hypothetical protein
MQTFSQYAATRLLREHPARAQTFGGIAIKTGNIQTYAGMDLITGMPVFIYTMPEKPSAITEVYSEYIPTVLELGFEHDLGFVITSSAPGYTPIKPVLTQPRLEWLTRASSRALADAHSVGLIHGNLEPSHFFACGDHLLLEGWGLPWGAANPDYQAPETNVSLATDVFAWARSMTMFGKGKPRLMLEGEFGRLIGHCLNPRPSERPTAQELVLALEQVLPAPNPTVTDNTQTASELPTTEFLETERNSSNPSQHTEPLEIPEKPDNNPEQNTQSDKPELSKPMLEMTLEKPFESMPEPEIQAENPVSPEAKLNALEAELSIKPNPQEHKTIEETVLLTTSPLDTAKPEEQKVNIPEPIAEAMPEPSEPEPKVMVTEPELATSTENPPEPPNLEATRPQSNAETPEELVPAQLHEPEHLAADEPDVALPSRASSRMTDDSDADAPRPAIRIGFDEEDQSWRSVVTPAKPSGGLGRWIIIAVLIGILIVIVGIFVSQPRTPSSPNPRPITIQGDTTGGSVVNFTLRGTEGNRGRLIIVSAPEGSKLAVGALLATVPGPVAFPISGQYQVRIEMLNYKPSEITVNVPRQTQITIELGK